jgi:hypothetical protein
MQAANICRSWCGSMSHAHTLCTQSLAPVPAHDMSRQCRVQCKPFLYLHWPLTMKDKHVGMISMSVAPLSATHVPTCEQTCRILG